MTRAERFSYLFIFLVVAFAALLHLATPLVTVLFSYFALQRLKFTRHKWLSLVLFVVLVSLTLLVVRSSQYWVHYEVGSQR